MFLGCTPAPEGAANGWPLRVLDDSLSGADGVDVTDIDGDGDLDAVAGWEESHALRLYLNPGPEKARSAWTAIDISGGLPMGKIEDARFADLDGDGVVEAVFSAEEKGSERIAAHWLTEAAPALPTSWVGEVLDTVPGYRFVKLAFGDLDGDGIEDVIVGAKTDGKPGALLWVRPSSAAHQHSDWTAEIIDSVEWVDSMLVMDIDGDGRKDILMNHSGFLGWFQNPGRRGQPWARHTIADHTGPYFAVCPAKGAALALVVGSDLSQHQAGDHTLTLVMLRQGRDPGWVLSEIRSVQGVPRDAGSQDYQIKGLACGSLDANPLPDIAITVSGEGAGVFALMNLDFERDAALELITIADRSHNSYKGIKYDNVLIADIDNDGDQDLITTEENGRRAGPLGYFRPEGIGVVWYENPLR